MTYLKYYQKEQNDFAQYHEIKMSRGEILSFVKEITEHFGLTSLKVSFTLNDRGSTRGIYYNTLEMIKLKKTRETSLLTIVHELAHHYDIALNGVYREDKYYPATEYIKRYGGRQRRRYRKSHTAKHKECVIRILNWYNYLQSQSKYDNAPTLKMEI